MHDPRRQLADPGQLLTLHNLPLDPARLGDVLPDRDHVADLVTLQAHGDLAQPEGAHFATQSHVELLLQDLAGLEDPIKVGSALLSRLAGQYLEHLAPHHLVAPETGDADLALPVPDLDPIVPIDDVESYREAVDDEADEPALLVYFPRLSGDFDREISGELDRCEERRQQVGRDRQHFTLSWPWLRSSFEKAYDGF